MLGQRLRQLEQQAAAADQRATDPQRQLDDALAAAARERADAAEAHLTAFTTALAASGRGPGDPA